MKNQKVLIGGIALVSLLIGGIAGVFLSRHIDFSGSNDLNSENKNLVTIPLLSNVKNELNGIRNSSKNLTILAKNTNNAKGYYNRIDSSLKGISSLFDDAIRATKSGYYKVTGNTTGWTNYNVTLNVDVTNGSLTPTQYSFDNGKTWQESPVKTFTSNQTAYIKIKFDGGLESAVNIQKIAIDKKKPTVEFSIQGTKYRDGYKSGAAFSAVCMDSQSGIRRMKTWFTQDSKVNRLFNSNAVTNSTGVDMKNQIISIVATGKNKSITVECEDGVGNITKVKSPAYNIYK